MLKFDDSKGATVDVRLAEYQQLIANREDWIPEVQNVSDWLLPGRGIYNLGVMKPPKRTIISPKIVNPKGKQAFEVLISALKEGITPSTRPWFESSFKDRRLRAIKPLTVWLYEAKHALMSEMRSANFYGVIKNYYKEICGFGTGAIFVGPGTKQIPLHYHVLTFGEYAIGTNQFGIVDRLYRTLFKNFHQLYEQFGDKLPKTLLEKYESRDATLDYWYTVVEGVVPEKFMDMPFTRFFILQCDSDSKYDGGVNLQFPKKGNKYPEFLHVEGAHEFPYPTTRFDTIGSDEYGSSPGMEAVATIKRLQEVVKSNSIAYHKSIRPPLNVPVHMRGQVRTYPDAMNYYIDPAQIITSAYDTRFDHRSAAVMEDSLDKTLQEIFYNDVFLTASRDPNASPLKAAQVQNWDAERFIRIGPTLERMFYEGITPIVTRSFNLLYRAGKLPPLPEEYQNVKPVIELELTSILAQMMKSLSAAPVNEFLQMVGAVAQYKQDVLDIPDFDSIVYDYADIKGVNPKHLAGGKDLKNVRANRAAAQQAEQQRVQQAQDQMVGSQAALDKANVAKTMSEAGANFSETMGEAGGVML